MKYLSERGKIVPLLAISDHEDSANSAGLYVGNAHHVTFVIVTAVVTGSAEVTTVSGTGHATFAADYLRPDVYRSTGNIAAAAADTLATVEYVANEDHFLLPDDDNRVVIMELDVNTITDGHDWVRVQFSSDASALNATIVAVVYPRRKPAGTMVTTT